MTEIIRDGYTIRIYRAGFRPGFYAECLDSAGKRMAFTGIYYGSESKERAIQSALTQATTGNYAKDDSGSQG